MNIVLMRINTLERKYIRRGSGVKHLSTILISIAITLSVTDLLSDRLFPFSLVG